MRRRAVPAPAAPRPRLVGDAPGEFAHQAFKHLELGDDLASLGAGAGLDGLVHLLHPVVGLVERELDGGVGAFQVGDLARGLALLLARAVARLHLQREEKEHRAGAGAGRQAREQPDRAANGG